MACRPLCAYCRQRPIEAPWVPFCSQRCKDVDLGRWLRGDYRVPAERQDLLEEEPAAGSTAGPPEEH